MAVLLSMLPVALLLGLSNGEMLGRFVFHNNNNDRANSFHILHKPHSINLAPNPGPIASDEVGKRHLTDS